MRFWGWGTVLVAAIAFAFSRRGLPTEADD
jgi:hypothetical protein